MISYDNEAKIYLMYPIAQVSCKKRTKGKRAIKIEQFVVEVLGHQSYCIAASVIAATGREVIAIRDGMEKWLQREWPSIRGTDEPITTKRQQDHPIPTHNMITTKKNM